MKPSFTPTTSLSKCIIRKRMLLISISILSLLFAANNNAYAYSSPSSVTLTITGTSWTATWPSTGDPYYYVMISTSSTFSSWSGGLPTDNSLSRSGTGLVAGTTYYFYVSGVSSGWAWGAPTRSNAATAYTAVTPGTPTSLSASVTGTTTADLSWSAGSPVGNPAATYYWLVGTSSSATYASGYTARGTTTGTTASATGLTENTTYYARVYANNSNGSSGYVTASSFTTPSNLSAVSVSSSSAQSICVGGTGTQLTASETGGGTITGRQWGKRSTSGGTITSLSGATASTFTPSSTNLGGAGTYYVVCTSTPTCGSAVVSNEVTVTVNALPTLAAITGTTTVCVGSTTTLANSQASGTWSSGSTGVATVNASSGVVTGVSAGTSVITYSYTNGNGCTNSVTTSVTVSALPATPSSVTATPSTICANATSNLNATSTGNLINWYTASTGGTLLGSSASGANYAVTPSTTTTYYAEAVTVSSGSQTFDYTGAATTFTVPAGVTALTIDAVGAAGGGVTSSYARGARIKGTVTVTPGQVLKVLVGGKGLITNYPSGGGGSFVTDNSNNPLVIAGGGGGYAGYSSTNSNASITNNGNNASLTNSGGLGGTNGGAGQANTCNYNGGPGGGLTGEWNSANGQGGYGGRSFINGGAGGASGSYSNSSAGGFGGGGGSGYGSGGGGGYSGGGGGANCGTGPQDGGGGGSYNAGTNKTETVGYNSTGHGQIIFTWTANNSCPSAARTAVTVTTNASLSAVSVTSSSAQSICVGGTGTQLTASETGGGTITGRQWGKRSTSGGTITSLSGATASTFTPSSTNLGGAGTYYVVCTSTPTCGSAVVSNEVTVTVNALPTLAAITGTTTVCVGSTTTLANSQASGTWSSGSTGVATVNASSGVVTGVSAGTSVITYSYTNGNGCTNSVTTSVTVSALPATPSSVTATPSTICANSTSNLNATSTGNLINWYTASTGGTLLGSSASGANYAVTPSTTTTYYAEAASSTSQTLDYSGSIVNFTVPAGVTTLTIDARGAQGGSGAGTYTGGLGARIKGDVTVTPGQVLKVLVGQQGGSNATYKAGGGGGGTFVTTNSNSPLVIAGGGSGGGGNSSPGNGNPGLITNAGGNSSAATGGSSGAGGGASNGSSGGGGLTGDGTASTATTYVPSGGKSFSNGGAGGLGGTCAAGGGAGGFGGGSGGEWCNAGAPGAGGGYSGGAGTSSTGLAGGGGSYNAGTNKTETEGYNTGNGQVIFTWTATSCPSAARTAVTVTTNASLSAVSVTSSSAQSICVGGTGTQLTASETGGGTITGRQWGKRSTSGGTITSLSGATASTFTPSSANLGGAGTYYVVCTSTPTCGSAVVSNEVTVTVNALPTLAAITGTTTVCVGSTTTLANSQASGTWSSGSTGVATVNASSGVVTGVSAGTSVITYSYTNGNGCTNSVTTTVTVSALPATPSSVTATPSSVCANSTSNLNATSTGNMINWYTASTGGTLLGSSASGANYAVTPSTTTTYYAEAVTTTSGSQTFDYTGSYQSFTAPVTGTYTLEAWGAQGGSSYSNSQAAYISGGKGGYAKRVMSLTANQTVYIYVGGQGGQHTSSTTGSVSGGYNGGGASSGTNTSGGGGGGGGATHMATASGLLSSLSSNQSAVLVVGAGGGGAWGCNAYSWTNYRDGSEGGAGGGTTGQGAGYGYTMGYTTTSGNNNINNQADSRSQAYNFATGGSQSSGGSQGCASGSNSYYSTSTASAFGLGASSGNASSHSGGGGGAGWYGGGAGASGENANGTGGAGGSSYNASDSNGANIMGNASMDNPSGGTMTGKSGNGYAKITWSIANPTSCPSAARTAVTVTTNAAASAGTVSGTSPLSIAGTATYTVASAVLSGGTGAWSSSNTSVATVNASSGLVTAVASGSCNIIYTVTGGCGGTVTAQQALTVNAIPSISSQPSTSTQSIGQNGSATALSITAAAGSGTISSYQWYSNTSNANTGGTTVGTNSASYTPLTSSLGTLYYYCVVTNSNGGTKTSNVSGAITVYANPTISVQPATGGQSIALNGTAVALTITAAAGSGTISSYQWYKNTSNANTGGTAVGTNSASYTPLTTATGTLYYYCVVTNSNTITLTSNVSGAIVVYALPSISVQPSTSVQTVCQNSSTTALSITASAGSGTISGYQWYKNASNSNSGGTSLSGATSASYTPSSASTGTLYYYCVVTNSNAGTATSNVSGAVTVTALPANPTSVLASPSTVCAGSTANLSAVSAGNNINWFTTATGGTSIGSSASGASYAVNPASTTTYYAEAVTNSGTSGSQTFSYTGSIANFTVPSGATSLVIEARGAQGGTSNTSNAGGKGAYIKGTVSVTPGQVLKILVGGQGGSGTQGGGGGGTFVTTNSNGALIVAGGGGGGQYSGSFNLSNADGTTSNSGQAGMHSGSSITGGAGGTSGGGGGIYTGYPNTSQGAGGGGLTGDGTTSGNSTGGKSFTNGGTGGSPAGSGGAGGFGGGGAADWSYWTGGGGGGGYSGGGGGTYYGVGGGGGSYNGGTSQTNTAGVQTGNGQVVITWTVASSASCTSASRTAVTVTTNSANAGTVSGTSPICIGSTTTFTVSGTTLSGGTGAWSSSNTAVATVNATSGLVTSVAAGTCNIVYTITNGCGGTVSSQKALTVAALPTLSAITGTTSFCQGATSTLSNTQSGGSWSSATTTVATVDASSGVVTGVSVGTSLITYTYTNANGCSNSISTTVTINALPTNASSVTATPSTVLSGSSSNLNATSTSNTINWYTTASGGTAIGISNSGSNFSVTPSATTTYYAEVVSAAGTNGTQTLSYTGAQQTFTVPAGVNSISIEAYGAQGGTARSGNGNLGGKGAYAKGSLAVTPGQTLYVYVGGQGGGAYNSELTGGGWNGGGHSNGSGDGGGGASDIRVGGTALSNRVIVAGGGGGNGWYSYAGGDGGGLTGSAGGNTTNSNAAYGGGGGTQSAGGSGSGTYPGASGTLGNGGNGGKGTSPYGYSGGGGGGYYGGAGGAGETGNGSGYGSAGGGGSSYTGGVTNATTTAGSRSGNGQVVLTWSANNISCPSASRTAVTVTVNSTPTITTAAASQILSTTATSGGNISSDGGASISAAGVCWSTSQNPTIANSKTNDASGTGSFTSSITGLSAGTTYYVRAYATNAMGTSYGNQISITPYQLGTFANINKTYGNPSFVLLNPISASNGTFSYSSSNTAVATVSGNTVTIVGAGSTTITSTQAAYGGYGSLSKTATLTVAKANQILTLNPLPNSAPLSTLIGNPQLITASSSASLTVTPSIASGPATVSLNSGSYYLTPTGSTGTAVIQVDQAGNDNYNAAQITHSIDVTKGNQTITFDALTPVSYSSGLTVDLTASASSALAVGLSVVSGPATISGNTLTITGAGTVVITASQGGNSSWNAATSVTRNLVVNKATANISFGNINKTYGDADFTVNATSASSGAFSYSSNNSAVATVAGNTITIVGAGTATITATQAASADYSSNSTTATLTVDKANQTINLGSIADVSLLDFDANPIQVTATASSGLTVAITLGSGSEATLNGSNQLISTDLSGSVTVKANQSGNDNYNAATEQTVTFNVNKTAQTITFGSLADKFSCDASYDLTASSSSALAVSYSSSNSEVATVSGSTITLVGAGTTTITASQSGNAYYNAASSVGKLLTVTACALPTIASTTAASSITSNTASSGGNVTADGGSPVTERGICWSTSANPSTADSKSWGGIGTGTFNGSITGLTPNTLYYVRAYATNGVGTVYGDQVSFSSLNAYNVTLFANTGIIGNVRGEGTFDANQSTTVVATPNSGFRFVDWTEDGTQVSTSASYTFTLTGDRSLTANFATLSINIADTKDETAIANCTDCQVTVLSTGTLSVNNTETINTIVVETGGKVNLENGLKVADVILNADQNNSFSAKVGTTGTTVTGTLKFHKTLDDTRWYFLSFPCSVVLSTITKSDGTSLGTLGTDWFVKWYDGAARITNLNTTTSWKAITNPSTALNPYQGYIFGFKDGTGTIEISVPLDKALIESEGARKIPVVAYGSGTSVGENHKGWNLIGQPYLSKLTGSSVGVNFLNFSIDGLSGYNQVFNSSIQAIDPFAAYFVQIGSTGDISFDINGRQNAKSVVQQSTSSNLLMLNFSNGSGNDVTNLILDDAQSPAYQIGQDLEKMISTGTAKPQVYSILNGINFVYNALPMSYVQNLPIGFYTKTAGSCTISVDASQAKGLNQLLLTDNVTSTVTDLLLSSYTFTATAGTNTSRFVLNAPKLTTDNQDLKGDGNAPWISTQNGKIVINNLNERTIVRVFDAIGRQLYHNETGNSNLEITPPADGIYTVQISAGQQVKSHRIIFKK